MRCRTVVLLTVTMSVLSLSLADSAGRDEKPVAKTGIDKRIPWTKSRVVGTPEPPPPYRVRRAFPKLDLVHPIAVAHEPGANNLLVVHQKVAWVGAGRILRCKDDETTDRFDVLLELPSTIYGLAFHPDFEKNGYLFVGHNGPVTRDDRDIPGQRFPPGREKWTRVSRFKIDRKAPFKCDPKSEQVIIEWKSNGHNGGDLAFGKDGMLYITAGDGTSDSDTNLTGQDLTKPLAKVLRIDVDHPDKDRLYSVPRDNPFLDVKDARPETYAYGLRNPWRISIDRPTGDIWVGNNGQDLWETVYLIQRGANYGWSVMEGSHPFYLDRRRGPTPISKPIAEHHHSEARSLTGGLVYRGKKLPDLRGAYLYGDWSTGKIWGLRHKEGKVVYHQELADTPLQITGFGVDGAGELLVVDHAGALYRLEKAPVDPNPPSFPRQLSATGLFQSVEKHEPDPGLIPYSVNAPLWSDGSHKERFIALPGDTKIDFKGKRGWDFPDGAVLVKTFTLDTEKGRRRIETRLLVKQQGEWAGYSYLWNDAQTDAELVDRAGKDVAYAVKAGGKQVWHYPSRAECMVCHSRAANFVLGLSVLQMNKVHDYGGVRANQLDTLAHLGVFKVSAVENYQSLKTRMTPLARLLSAGIGRIPGGAMLTKEARSQLDGLFVELRKQKALVSHLPRTPAEYPRLVDPYDDRQPIDLRARSYLHANCAQCHVTAGGGNAFIDLEFSTPLERMKLVGVKPNHNTLKLKEPRLIEPGQPERSILYERVARRGEGQMPPLATSQVDAVGTKLLRAWIEELKK